ncbi:uncharacterized protein L3040_000057 [Drepanopeziza brunnea f. sp. 'multigermtubi']|uniref:uncharacterized protein n=1 Tax=Drepanopeziza brunnea f. sp. 'multigermtubi' TaxID=698441 RepID=UPI0023977DBF|nr:hypothetical protein L3040_000057 [Drepanopeziza brunnea f. sp. 'multigermtubi']
MQTGNTIFLALGASAQPRSKPFAWLKSLIFLHNPFPPGLLHILHQPDPHPRNLAARSPPLFSYRAYVLSTPALGFLAFQSGGQIVTSRILSFNEVPTTVLTSVYCDIASDLHIFKRENVKRNRRVAAVVCILAGGIAGGWISRSATGMSVSL